MSILHVRATIQCEGCGKPFTIDLDLAGKHPSDLADEVDYYIHAYPVNAHKR